MFVYIIYNIYTKLLILYCFKKHFNKLIHLETLILTVINELKKKFAMGCIILLHAILKYYLLTAVGFIDIN